MEKILIVDDEELITESLSSFLNEKGYDIKTADCIARAKNALQSENFDLVLLDLKLPDGQGIELLDFISKEKEKPLVIMMTAYGTIGDAVKAIKKGAYDFIQKPFRTKDIEIIIKLALETTRLERELRQAQKINAEKYGIKNIIGSSPGMEEIYRIIKKISDKGVKSVLILGESGVGKELIAKAIHYESRRSLWPFVAINCSSIPSNLLESELYGYEKGAFTDARDKKIGLLEKANKGTLFLDEIGDMNYELQSKLLRTLEERTIRRIGGTTDIPVDIQVISATNQDIEKLVSEGKFRKDLYFRLKVVEIKVPPLRERKEDIML
ncbi:MAG: sigma-54 dependent transcriptional regulator, partial [Proteobacteria bacterium]|nr:sigma-54 dependent transcriptional regulator [Pseudomonadota bacterium]